MWYQELTLEEYRQLIREYHHTRKMPQRLQELVDRLSVWVTGTAAKRTWNEHRKNFLLSEREDCKQAIRCKLVKVLSDPRAANACHTYPERWLYRIAEREAREFAGRFLSDCERGIAFDLCDTASGGLSNFARGVDDRLQLEKFLRYLRRELSEEKARRYEKTLGMLYEGAKQNEIAVAFGVKHFNVAYWLRDIRALALKFLSERKGRVILIAWLLPLIYGN